MQECDKSSLLSRMQQREIEVVLTDDRRAGCRSSQATLDRPVSDLSCGDENGEEGDKMNEVRIM